MRDGDDRVGGREGGGEGGNGIESEEYQLS